MDTSLRETLCTGSKGFCLLERIDHTPDHKTEWCFRRYSTALKRVYYRASHIPQTAIVCSSKTANRFSFFYFLLKTKTANNFWTINKLPDKLI